MRKSGSTCQMELGNRCEAMAAALSCLPGLTLTNRHTRPQCKTLHAEKDRSHKNYHARLWVICLVVALAFVTEHLQSPIRAVQAAESAVKTTGQQPAPINQTASATKARQAAGTKEAATSKTSQQTDSKRDQKATRKSTPANLDSEATDLSSMYVQIPIAEPVGEGASAAEQQSQQEASQEADSGADSSKATTWTGPWPKKFQIGYIKQSDLHQVLIESLKSDPFIGTTKSATATTATPSKSSATKSAVTQAPVAAKSAPPSDAASLMAAGYPQLKAVQQTVSGNHDHAQQRPSIGVQQHQQQQQARQQYWPPTVQTYGRLSMPHVMMPRPKGNLHVLGTFMQQQQQHAQHHRNLRHQLAGQNHHAHMQEPGFATPNSYRQNVHFNHANRQQSGHNMQLLVQQQPKGAMMSAFAQQLGPQYQFASLPSSSMRNQPVYTMNNFPAPQQHQQQSSGIDADPMQLLQMAGLGAGQQQVGYGPAAGHLNAMGRAQAPKMSEYIASSWRPVTNQDEERQVQQNSNEASMNDGFDDGFNMPNGATKDSAIGQNSSSSSESINRHPMLNSYLGQQSSSTKVSPANMLKNRDQQPGTRSKSSGSTKGGREEDEQQQKMSDDGSTKSGTGRRALPNNSTTSAQNATITTTTTPSSLIGSENGTTIAQESVDSTTAASVTITTIGSLAGGSTTSVSPAANSSDTTTSSSQEEATTEPDSEVIEGEATTEPDEQEAATTTASSIESLGRSSSTVAPSSSSASGNTDSDAVATQTPASVATFPAVQSEEASTASAADSTTTNSNREETTPNSLGAPSSSTASAAGASPASSTTERADIGAKGGEVEGAANSTMRSASLRNGGTDATLSDEQLMAAARASDLTKSKTAKTSTKGRFLTGQQASPSATAKKARSSNSQSNERLVQAREARQKPLDVASSTTASTAPGRKSQQTKLITRRPQTAPSRAAKQISGGIKSSTSGGAQSDAAKQKAIATSQKKQAKSSAKSAQTKAKKASSQKITRMVQSERLQATQVVSMSPAQAQSTAQTLASLLLSRCLSSSNCAHLLDVCSTKQAAVPINLQPSDATDSGATNSNSSANSAAWSMPVGLMSSQLMSLMEALQADRALKLLPAWRDAIENIVDQDTQTGYTLLMPSNEAIERISAGQLDALLASGEQMSQLIDNHILDSAETIEIGSGTNRTASRYLRSKRLQLNQHRDRQLTLNGKRLVYANQLAPGGGRIHVIDGLLDWPSGSAPGARLLDIMDTLKQCDKFDGFVTLAEGTGLAQILKQDEPLTVFVPSNEALRKIPDEELEVIKNNSTALREFIMYHIVNGSYFSQDLRDGQQLTSILDMKPIQVGVRVDGCSRRLVEANTSPMRRPDIVAKNGVIHILDWYLTTRDNEWCDQVGRSQASLTSSGSSSAVPRDSSERLQQLASEPMVVVSSSSSVSSSGPSSGSLTTINNQHSMTANEYATRMKALPANHKQEQLSTDELQAQASGIKPTITAKTDDGIGQAHSVYVSALPISELHKMP